MVNLPAHGEEPPVENDFAETANQEMDSPNPTPENESSPSPPNTDPLTTPTENGQFTSPTCDMKSPTDDAIKTLTGSLLEQLKMNRLPPPEPIVFSGDPMQYITWKQGYDILIEHRGVHVPPAERFFYLKKYLKGEALDLVRGFSLVNDESAYKEAKRALDKRYGDPFIVSNAFRDKLDSWPTVAPKMHSD
ncbi:uncharacterized protein LOC115924586 [Strongylocentrotus purpuratus]|uniref:Uncharacterized protein n=1 Tax=Strongylocentrotus purpuratus TaxID=7668 RepID=A0A7M7NXF1_STRPU|nr:uncharacterized protein LOC115924586 [Strongylocentrotus purpuratus]